MANIQGSKKHVELAVTLSLTNVANTTGTARTPTGEVPTIPPENDETPENAEQGAASRDPRADLKADGQKRSLVVDSGESTPSASAAS